MSRRQELYKRIRERSKDDVILDEMIRLGFWPREGELPEDPADEIRRRTDLQQQLRALTKENRRLANTEALRREAHRRRLEASRKQRQENKQRRQRQREQRAEAWNERKQQEILYLGAGYSAGLGDHSADASKLTTLGLPVLHSANDLASAMKVSIGALRFLAFARKTSSITHYQRFAVRKKTGGVRHLSAPMPRLKRAQHWILERILEPVPIHDAAHGFRKGRSIVSGAKPHTGAAVVINVDLEDFFPTVTYRRIKGVYRSLGYGEEIATILSLLCSEPDVCSVTLDGQPYHVARTPRRLPQGAPTSPAITNIICRGLDARLDHAAQSLGFTYTRYADDMTFSGPRPALRNIGKLLRRVRYVCDAEGFRLHPQKTRVLHAGSRQEVTGLTVNERVNIPRRTMRNFRATLYQIERDGPAGKSWGQSDDVMTAVEGFANFVHMVDPERGAQLQQRVAALIERYGRLEKPRTQRARWRPRPKTPAPSTAPTARPRAKSGPKKKRPWWMFWKFW